MHSTCLIGFLLLAGHASSGAAPGAALIPAELFSSAPATAEQYGHSIDIQGDVMAVGVPTHFDTLPSGITVRGAVYIYRWVGGGWQQVQLILNHIHDLQSRFGQTVSLDGQRLAIADTGFAEFAGTVHVYQRPPGGSWALEDSLNLDVAFGAEFGSTLALEGDLLHVGINTGGVGGSVIYRREADSNWVVETQLLAPTPSLLDAFGLAVDLEGDLAFAAASGGGSPAGSGEVHVYKRASPGRWNHVATIPAPDGMAGDGFGSALAASGDRLVVGAPYSDRAASASGSAFVFRRVSDSDWALEQELLVAGLGFASTFGLSLDIEGDRLIAGLPAHSQGAVQSGKAVIFQRRGSTWSIVDEIRREEPFNFDFVGGAVAIGLAHAGAAGEYASQVVQDDWHGGVFTIKLAASNPADLDGDGIVGGLDLALLLGVWGACLSPSPGEARRGGPAPKVCPADLDHNTIIDGLDLAILLAAWGQQ